MATIHFYEKPGCYNNARQKQLLVKAGHLLVVYDLLAFAWAENRQLLRSFFGDLPVSEWFNRSAPALKDGAVKPELLNESQAIDLMVADPLLIRRPLIEVEGRRRAGFDAEKIDAWLGLSGTVSSQDLETCSKQPKQQACSP